MKKRILSAVLAVVIAAAAFCTGIFVGRREEPQTGLRQEYLSQYVNLLNLEEPVYVIGHKSPDSDTVLSSIVLAKLLNEIGVSAEARVAEPLNDESKAILGYFGVEAPQLLEDASGKNLFLVDHNEYAQMVNGYDTANIVGIVDHHNVGDVKSVDLIYSRTAPLGATTMLVYSMYKELNVPVDQVTAGLIIGGELSDTNNMRYKDAFTKADEIYMEELLKLSGVNREELNMTRLKAKVNYAGKSSHDLLFLDYKNYQIGGKTLGIGTLNSVGREDSQLRIQEMLQAMDTYYAESQVDYLYLMIHDYDTDEQYILCKGEGAKELCQKAMDTEFETYLTLKESISRKSAFVPALTRALEK